MVRVLINLSCKVLEIITGFKEKIAIYTVKLLRSVLDAQDACFSYDKY